MHRAGKMAARAGPLRVPGQLCRVLLFLSQLSIVSGGGELQAGAAAGLAAWQGPGADGEHPAGRRGGGRRSPRRRVLAAGTPAPHAQRARAAD